MSRYTNANLRTEYRSLFGLGCEVWPYLTRDEKQAVKNSGAGSHIEIHHINRRGQKRDYWSNIIGICQGVHWLGHNGMDHAEDKLRILCLYSKFVKSREDRSVQNPYPDREFNLDELNDAAGKRVLGFLENCTQLFPEESSYFQMCKFITEAH